MTIERAEPGHGSEDDLLREAGIPAGDGGSSEVVEATETETVEPRAAVLPKRIGQYSIKRVIASGGMGTVYEAVQEKPRRTVAVKLMRAGIASRSALRRFESQVLARLRHPGIAQVYEAGTHGPSPWPSPRGRGEEPSSSHEATEGGRGAFFPEGDQQQSPG